MYALRICKEIQVELQFRFANYSNVIYLVLNIALSLRMFQNLCTGPNTTRGSKKYTPYRCTALNSIKAIFIPGYQHYREA